MDGPRRDDEATWLARALDATERAVERVRLDLERTSDLRPEILVDVDGGRPRVRVDGSYATEVVDPDQPEATASTIADYVQEQLMDEHVRSFWPTCPSHGSGLHAEVHAARAVWWCRAGRHALGDVGELRLES